MKISKIYSSKSEVFEPILFNDSLNIIIAKITLPENIKKTSHSLGKTTLSILIDFCLLKSKNKSDFMWKRLDLFKDYDFFLEILLDNGQYCTIKRSVKARSKIFIKLHKNKNENFSEINDDEWDFSGAIEKAKEYLNNVLDFNVLRKYDYRKTLSYFLRKPEDFGNEFQLSKNMRSKAHVWKSPLLELFGYSSDEFIKKYNIDLEVDRLTKENKELNKQVSQETEQEKRLKLVISEKEQQLKTRKDQYDNFNFTFADIEKPKELIEDIDKKISDIVKENYYLESKIKLTKDSISEYKFDLDDIKKFYEDLKVYFSEYLIKDYNDLIEFNKKVTDERNDLLEDLLKQYIFKYDENCSKLKQLNCQRSNLVKYIEVSKVMEKFKVLQNDIIELKTYIDIQKQKLKSLDTEVNNNKELSIKKQEQEEAILTMDNYLISNPLFSKQKELFNKIMKDVLGDIGLLDIKLNSNKNPEFISEIIDIESNNISAKDKGTSFKKLMCCAFDLAILASYSETKYIHFVYHDGVFDGLDNRQKNNYFNTICEFCDDYGIQYIFTCIEDELPPIINTDSKLKYLKEQGIIIKELSDNGDEGRLFKMPAF
ncbi:hypothetical protein Z957_05235 [Clostridium sp. K25]|uniref:DUF2326 domain-containing protein n=1 Tax=Clostridium sp. K25 TaxID=1443109 RepID=UPI0004D5EF2F|nr:DUF2326 domain-containing protein [Clostridium sp. K25]KEI09307.1 hypothetical protein Z957_05235 [Clostridium sp. K25]